jgi:ubiquinone/menaquinone biosynthesis C-methylase UbiE
VRLETYGEDLGQASWITVDEYQRFLSSLAVGPESRILEVACGSGGLSVRMSQDSGAEVVGVDANVYAIAAATERIRTLAPAPRATFQLANAGEQLPFPAESFDAVFCNDSINHLPERDKVLRDWYRVLRRGGRILYTDPIVVTGWLSNEEIAARSSVRFFLFVPVGANEHWLRQAGFELLSAEDVTENVVQTLKRWHAARDRRRDALVQFEGEASFEGVQNFLATVHTLSSERRLSRFAFLAQKPD